MEVRNATSASNTIIKNICTMLNSQFWGTDYITDQPTVPKFGKQIGTIKFIYNLFSDLPTVQNLNAMKSEDQCIQLVEYTVQYYDVKNCDTIGMCSILYQ